MITQERMEQLSYLLSQILNFTKFGLSVRDAGICAFFSTAEKYCKKEPTIRDMVTRSCGVNTDIFYEAIKSIFDGNDLPFKEKYYSYIPKSMHSKMDATCNHFMTLGVKPPKESPEHYARLIKKFTKSSPGEKRNIIRLLL